MPAENVVHVIHDLRRGGSERRMLNLLAALDRERFEPRLVCVDGLGDLAEEAAAVGVEPIVLGRRRRGDLSGVLRLAALVRRERAAVVHGWLYLANLFARLGGRAGRAPVVVASEGGAITTTNTRKRRRNEAIDRALVPLTDCVVANSRTVADTLRLAGVPMAKIEVIPNGVPLPPPADARTRARLRVELGVGTGERLVGMVARLDPEFKDHESFLRAAAELRRDLAAVRFAVVGDGPARARLERLARELGVSDAVRFTGFRADARDLPAALDVSVLCTYSEGFSNVLLESMAWGRPVVATDIPPNREAIDDGVHGLLVPIRDPAATASAISRLLHDESLARALGAAARDRVERCFSLERQAELTMALYDRLLARKRG